jgi:hypothetical protein
MSGQMPFTLDQPSYRLRPDEVARSLNTDFERGLSKQEANRRHDVVGDNALEGGHGVSIWKVFIRQVANALTLVTSLQSSDYRFWSWRWHCHTVQQILLKAELLPPSSCVTCPILEVSNGSKHYNRLLSRVQS